MTISASPLTWPEGWPRTKSWARSSGKFKSQGRQLSVAEAVSRVREELKKMGLKDDDIIVSTNLRLRLDGLPRSDQPEPGDTGAAVYWETKKGNKVMAIDRYYRVADNLAAIAATLEAMRAIERHGGAEILDRAFTGFTALPAPATSNWRTVLDLLGWPADKLTADDIQRAYRQAASKAHPDKDGGSTEAMQRVNAARDAALKEIQQCR